jgi:ribonuclease R/exosome complex exonuclease DIS3/RRP44
MEKKIEGEVVEVLKRSKVNFVGVLQKNTNKNFGFVCTR